MEAAKELLDLGTDVNVENSRGSTPLHFAASAKSRTREWVTPVRSALHALHSPQRLAVGPASSLLPPGPALSGQRTQPQAVSFPSGSASCCWVLGLTPGCRICRAGFRTRWQKATRSGAVHWARGPAKLPKRAQRLALLPLALQGAAGWPRPPHLFLRGVRRRGGPAGPLHRGGSPGCSCPCKQGPSTATAGWRSAPVPCGCES